MKKENVGKKLTNPIFELQKTIEQLENRIIQLEKNFIDYDENGYEILKQGIEYIRTIENGKIVNEFNWDGIDYIKYCIQLKDTVGDWEVNLKKTPILLYKNTILKFYIIGRKLTNYRILNANE